MRGVVPQASRNSLPGLARPRVAACAVLLATVWGGADAGAQVDSAAAREARAALRAVQKLYGSQAAWPATLRALAIKDVEYELRAGDSAQAATLLATANALRAGSAATYKSDAWQRLAAALEKRAAELASIPPELWPVACDQEAESDARVTIETLHAARAELKQRLDELERRLPPTRRGGNEWQAFLCWPDSQALLAADDCEAATIDRLEIRWRGAPTVWDAPELVEAALAMQTYLRLLRGYQAGETQQEHAAAWKELERLLAARSLASQDDLPLIAAQVNQRERLGQASPLTASIRREFSRPNIILQAQAAWLRRQLTSEVSEPYNVNEVFDGVRSVGRGTLSAQIGSQILPSRAVGQMIFQFQGTAQARTSSHSQGVSVRSRATTQIHAEKPFLLDAGGAHTQAATVSANTTITYESIDAPGLRWRRAESRRRTYAKRPGAAARATAATRRAIATRMDDAGNELLARFNRSYQERLRSWQFDSHDCTTQVRVCAADDAVRWESRLETPFNFAAPAQPPAFDATADVSLCLAATALEAQCLMALGGKQLTGAEIAREIGDLLGDSSEPDQDGQDFTATFAERPCDVTLADGQIQTRFYVTSFDSAEVQYPAMTVDARYIVSERDGDLQLGRQGGVQVWPLAERGSDKPALGGRQQTLRVAVQRKMSKAFPKEILWPAPTMSAGEKKEPVKLRVQNTAVAHGWLQVAFRQE